MELEPGFKLSEAGPIPKDWEAKTIGELAANVRNAIVGGPFGSDLTAEDYRSHGVPVIRGSNLHGRYVQGPFVYVSTEKGKALEANLARPGDVVFTQRGTLGQVALVPFGEHEAYLVSQSQMKVSLNAGLACNEFIVQVFNHPEYKRKVIASAIQTGVPHLNLSILRGYVIPRPTVEEQKAIARALSDIDTWIVDAESEVSKLASVKAAAMNALLTRTTHLPGFFGEWERVRLGDLGTLRKGRGITRSEVRATGIPVIRYGELYTRFDSHIRQFYSYVSAESAQGALRLQWGDICFAASGETADEIGKCAAVLHDGPCFAGGDIIVLSLHRDDPTFLGYLLNTPVIAEQKARLGQGDAVVHIHADKLAELELHLPNVSEQQAIATLLSDIDAALATARAVVAKARGVKAAAMDALLSGRVRLPPFGPAAQRTPNATLEFA